MPRACRGVVGPTDANSFPPAQPPLLASASLVGSRRREYSVPRVSRVAGTRCDTGPKGRSPRRVLWSPDGARRFQDYHPIGASASGKRKSQYICKGWSDNPGGPPGTPWYRPITSHRSGAPVGDSRVVGYRSLGGTGGAGRRLLFRCPRSRPTPPVNFAGTPCGAPTTIIWALHPSEYHSTGIWRTNSSHRASALAIGPRDPASRSFGSECRAVGVQTSVPPPTSS